MKDKALLSVTKDIAPCLDGQTKMASGSITLLSTIPRNRFYAVLEPRLSCRRGYIDTQ